MNKMAIKYKKVIQKQFYTTRPCGMAAAVRTISAVCSQESTGVCIKKLSNNVPDLAGYE